MLFNSNSKKMSVLDENWKYEFKINSIERIYYKDFENKLEDIYKIIFDLLEDGLKLQNNASGSSQNHDDELEKLIEGNKHIQNDIDEKIKILSQKKTKYEDYKKDQKLLLQEIKDTHEAFLMAKKYYRKLLKMYYTIESKDGTKQRIFVQFFTESKKESIIYSAHLLKDIETGKYHLLDTTPKLDVFEEIQQKLQDTNDIPGALCYIRLAFKNIKDKL